MWSEDALLRLVKNKGFQDKLLWQIHDGDSGARSFLTSAMQGLVSSVARKYSGHGVSHLKLVRLGNDGLHKAIDHYIVPKQYKFSTYATWWIRAEICRELGLDYRAKV